MNKITIILIVLFIILCLRNTKREDVSHIRLPSNGYFINLPHRSDRIVEFEKHMKKSDFAVNIEKLTAVDGSKLDMSKIKMTHLAEQELKDVEINGYRSKHYQLTKGAVGYYLSHLNTWEKILQNDEEYAFVFEDDAYIPRDFAYQVKRLLKHAPKFDIMLLGVICNECSSKPKYRKVNRFFQLHAYIISKSCIHKIMPLMFPISQQIDAHLSDLSHKIRICAPKRDISVQNFWVRNTDIQAPLENVKGLDPYEPVK